MIVVDQDILSNQAEKQVHIVEPFALKTGSGGDFKVFTPFWKAVRGRQVAAALPAPITKTLTAAGRP